MPGPDGARFDSKRALALGLALCSTFACFGGSGDSEQVKEIVDVRNLPQVDTSNDPRAVPRKAALIGILPSDFPADIPLYLPASLVDFANQPGGLRSVELLSPHPPAKVQPQLFDLLRDSGWSLESSSSGTSNLHKGSRLVRLIIGEGEPGTLYRFEY